MQRLLGISQSLKQERRWRDLTSQYNLDEALVTVAVTKWPLWMASYGAQLSQCFTSSPCWVRGSARPANPLRVVVSELGRAEIARDPTYYTKVVVPSERLWEVPGVAAEAPLEERFVTVAEKLDLLSPFETIAQLASMEEAASQSMLEQLFRLNQVTKIIDLHAHNVLLTKENQFALIDLEPLASFYDKSQTSRAIRYDKWYASWDPRVFGIIGIRKYEQNIAGVVDTILNRPQYHYNIGFSLGEHQRMIEVLGGENEAAKKLNQFVKTVSCVADREVSRLTRRYRIEYAVRYGVRLAALIGGIQLFRKLHLKLSSQIDLTRLFVVH
jgi:hypothetical protein